ncbi:MAG: adenine methyltransferase [Bacteroidetes bacterium]|nr:adenine methyltransferase [Bacteroidota bacterium]
MLKEYLNNIQVSINQGDAREESYYTHLDNLIRNFVNKNKIKKADITILPKKTEAGNPDFRIWDGINHITGYIEAKDPSITNLDRIEESEQLKRYRSTFPNIILTNFYEFRLYRDGEPVKKVSVGRPVLARKLKTAPPVENETEFDDLLNTFFSFSLPLVRNARTLALELAKRTRFLRDEVISIEIAEILCVTDVNKILQDYYREGKGKDKIMEDSGHYSRIITALSKTIGIQKQIDEIYPDVEKELIEL